MYKSVFTEPGILLKMMLDVEILLTLCHMCVAFESGFAQDDRVIDETPLTVKVISGSTAILPCSVDPKYTEGLSEQYSVLWQNPMQTVISVKDRRVLTDMRISVERPFVTDWNLHIRNVSVTDTGEYLCQINTDPVRSKTVNLVVQVPPTIIDYSDPDDVKVRVGDSVELMCNASGIPTPTITWYRLNTWSSKKKEKVGHEGEVLRIHNISKQCADTYECVANNTVPPSRSRQIKVTVQYPPRIRLLTPRIGQRLRKETILECVITASPLGLTMWRKDGEELTNSFKYELDVYNEGPQTITLSLRIAHIDKEDFGGYTCEASNKLGKQHAVMELYEIYPVTTTPSTTSTQTTTIHRKVIFLGGNTRKDKRPNPYGEHLNGNVITNTNNRPIKEPGHKNKKPAGASLTGMFGTGSVKYDGSAGPLTISFSGLLLCVLLTGLVQLNLL